MDKKLIDKICWFIPFRAPRDHIRNLLNNLKKPYYPLEMHATPEERCLFLKYIKYSKSYLEFGSGGSTRLVLETTNASVVSVESDAEFINILRYDKKIKKHEKKSRLKFIHIDIGIIGDWGFPINNYKRENYPMYSQHVYDILGNEYTSNIDTVFIDGRFRVACILKAILNLGKDTVIIIHDFWNREEYHVVLKFLDKIDALDSIGIFKQKNNIDKNLVMDIYNLYKYDYQ